ncbi:MAG: glycine cleavage system aminomethyltransferase GcvT [Planctomycetota bacterium]|nr:MAG: glycine cleavage system aminomethyltransferase GcvT [Planctomycetota bacterium]
MAAAADLKRTPLTGRHEAAGARLVDFAGFAMPVQYEGIMDEARRVRGQAGLFDLCHMGRVRITGDRREEAAQFLVHVNVEKMKHGAIRYSVLARDDGTTMDDVLIYRDVDEVFFCINAGNRARDIEWMRDVAARYDCELEDQSDELAMIAIQGPRSAETVAPLCSGDAGALKYYKFYRGTVCDVPAMISRTGYTGEDGYELYFAASEATRIWDALLEAGSAFGVTPIGLAARDTLRLEAGMALYGHELDDSTNPVEAGVIFKALPHKKEFSGRAAIEAMLEAGPERVLVGFTTESKRVPRQGYDLVTVDHTPVGTVCSGSPSPTLGINIGTAYVAVPHDSPTTELAMDIRGVRHPIKLHALPFYQRER